MSRSRTPRAGEDRAPRISVITPCLNDARYLPETLRSIHGQRYPALEHIVIDGGSTDGSREIIAAAEARLAYWVSEPDAGHADALWKGLSRATGELVTWVCSNDVLLPGALQTVSDFFVRHSRVSWAAGHGLMIDPESRVRARLWAAPISLSSLLYWLPWGVIQPAVFMRRGALAAVGGVDRERHVSVDTDLLIRMARRFGPPARINAFLAALRDHPDSQTHRRMAEVQAADEEIRRRAGRTRLPPAIAGLIFKAYDVAHVLYQRWRDRVGKSGYELGTVLTTTERSSAWTEC